MPSISTTGARSAEPGRSRSSPAGALLLAVIGKLVEWQYSVREREQLAALSDAALSDVGLTRADIQAELQKPRWRR